MKKRMASLLLALVMALTLLPAAALAEDTPSARVDFTAQAAGAFLLPPQFDVEVSGDLAERYGYGDEVTDGVSALDVLVKAHELLLGDSFTAETAADYLEVSGGSVSKLFGTATIANGFVLNGGYPNDGTESSWGGYNGTTVATQAVVSGDLVEFFLYQDTAYWSDSVSWFEHNGGAVEELTVRPAVSVPLSVKSVMFMMAYLYKDSAALRAAGEAVESAQLAWVDADGTVTAIADAVTDENGKTAVTMPEAEGTYYLTAYMPAEEIEENAQSPLVMSLLEITVDEDAPELEDFTNSCDLMALSVADLESNPNALSLTPAFDRGVTDYCVDTVAFQQYAKLAYVKATAASDQAVITAVLNGTEQTVTSGDAYWTTFNNMLPGEDNVLSVVVTNGERSKTYTVTIPMAADPSLPHLRGDAGEKTLLALGSDYTLNLDAVFADSDSQESLTYTVSLNGADAVAAEREYCFTPEAVGSYTLVFTASDGANTSPAYTVTLTVVTATDQVMHNIAARYVRDGFTDDPNWPWIAADLAAYAKAFPETENRMTAAQKQAILDAAIRLGDSSGSPADLAKAIIVLRSLGYDARKVITEDNRALDVVKKLTDLVDAKAGSVSGTYTLPYVLMGLQQGEGYVTDAQLDWMLEEAIKGKDGDWGWLNTSWGPDGATPMVLALQPYCGRDEVQAAVDEGFDAIAGTQAENGSLNTNDCSTGLGMAAYAAFGQSGPEKDGKTMADGLMTYVTNTLDGFYGWGTPEKNDPWGTEQGFRGLVAQALGGRIYDFAAMPAETAWATSATGAVVTFRVVPADAAVEVKQGDEVQTADAAGLYYLGEGTYTYTVSKSGYETETGSFTVTGEEAAAHAAKTISASLSLTPAPDAKTIKVTVKVVTHDEDACGGKYTYKSNASAFKTVLAKETVTLKAGQTVYEALEKTLDANEIPYTEKSFGYIDSIGGISEFDHGSPRSGWMFMVDGVVVETNCRDQKLRSDSTVIWFFTDDYTNEKGSEKWSGGSSAVKPVETLKFTDVAEDDYYYDAVKWAVEQGITDGVTETAFAPASGCTRAQMVTFLWRAAGSPEPSGKTIAFTDVAQDAYYAKALAWAVENGITSGITADSFAPNAACTRAQMAAFLYRFAKKPDVKGSSPFADVQETDYFHSAVLWAVQSGVTKGTTDTSFAPGGVCTRGQMVTFLYRYLGK